MLRHGARSQAEELMRSPRNKSVCEDVKRKFERPPRQGDWPSWFALFSNIAPAPGSCNSLLFPIALPAPVPE